MFRLGSTLTRRDLLVQTGTVDQEPCSHEVVAMFWSSNPSSHVIRILRPCSYQLGALSEKLALGISGGKQALSSNRRFLT